MEGVIRDTNGVARAEYSWGGAPFAPLSRSASGTFDLNLPLSPGENRFSVRATDAAGNGSPTITHSYFRDATPPEVIALEGGNAATIVDEATMTVAKTATTLRLSGGRSWPMKDNVEFGKYASRYRPNSPNLPVWRFNATEGIGKINHLFSENLMY